LPSSAELSWGKALVYRRQGRWEEALAEQPRSVKLSPRDANYAIDYADTLLFMRLVDEALEMYERSIALRPDQSWAYVLGALGHMLVGDFAASRRRLEAMPKPDERLGHLAWNLQLRIEGRYREMIDRLEADPFTVTGLPFFHYPRSLVLAQAHDLAGNREQSARLYVQAVAELETLVKENDQDPRLHGALGLAYAGSGLGGQAIASGRRAMELLPISRDAIFGTARVYEMALILTRVGDRAAALEQIERLLVMPNAVLSVPILQADPVWKSLRDDPGYAELIARHPDVPGIGE
jgi:tetratricopeptide (TPR) repeat protein